MAVDALLTAEQAGPLVNLHPDTLLRYARQGRVKVVKIGRKRRFRESDLQKFIDENTGAEVTELRGQRTARNPNRTYKS